MPDCHRGYQRGNSWVVAARAVDTTAPRDLARAASLDKASINRFESGQRSPSERARVEDICDALKVEGAERDALLWSAGYMPGVYETVAPTDPTLLAVARALASPSLGDRERAELRTVMETIANRWAGEGGRE